MKILVAIIFLMPLSVLAAGTTSRSEGGVFIGNHGDGLEIGDHLYVWDLFAVGAEKNPYIGLSADPALSLPAQTIGFKYPRELLARKLTDLNRIAPGMGDFVLESMKRYTWVTADWPLLPVVPAPDVVPVPAGGRLIQLANRFSTTIKIHAGGWSRLDETNQVALLIHEAVFSLVRPVQGNDGSQVQPARTAQLITGAFFTPSYYAKSPSAAYAALAESLVIPEAMLAPQTIRKPNRWIFDATLSSGKTAKTMTYEVGDATTTDSLHDFLKSVCLKTDSFSKTSPDENTRMSSTYVPRAIQISIASYPIPGGGSQPYVRIQTSDLPPLFQERDRLFLSKEDCVQRFGGYVDRIMALL